MEDTDRWHVLYRDGTELDEDMAEAWAAVDTAHVALLQLREGDQVVASVLIPDGAEPVCFRRRAITVIANGTADAPAEAGRATVTICGYAYPSGDAVWLWRNPDGVVVVSQGEIQTAD